MQEAPTPRIIVNISNKSRARPRYRCGNSQYCPQLLFESQGIETTEEFCFGRLAWLLEQRHFSC
jgi:hypothetical protein